MPMFTHRPEAVRSPPSRGAWIEIRLKLRDELNEVSPPSRGAWIEMTTIRRTGQKITVAPLAGGVD